VARRRGPSPVQVYTDPLQHALIAAAVVAPLVPRSGTRVIATAVAAATVIDIDHAIAARSFRLRATTSLPARPRSHNVFTALGTGAVVGTAAGPAHGWAAFSALVSHLLHDAGDSAAPTPMLWPFAAARQLGRRWQLAGTVVLAVGSVALSRVWAATSTGPSAAPADDGGAGTPPQTG
jgi:LexA-binding, inner membrane-associated putative hydrolase